MKTGDKYHCLTADARVSAGVWRFKCDCGSEKVARMSNVKAGSVKHCGCVKRENVTEHPLYWRWAGMLARCENPNHERYKDYGGRGVKVCERWHDFRVFLADMGNAPPGTTLDRHPNNNGNYEPNNCRWATNAEQQRNTSRNVYVEHDGVKLTIRDWEARLGLKRGAIQQRIDRGWDHVIAVTLPLHPGKPLRARL